MQTIISKFDFATTYGIIDKMLRTWHFHRAYFNLRMSEKEDGMFHASCDFKIHHQHIQKHLGMMDGAAIGVMAYKGMPIPEAEGHFSADVQLKPYGRYTTVTIDFSDLEGNRYGMVAAREMIKAFTNDLTKQLNATVARRA